jgi:hypothetical protein
MHNFEEEYVVNVFVQVLRLVKARVINNKAVGRFEICYQHKVGAVTNMNDVDKSWG